MTYRFTRLSSVAVRRAWQDTALTVAEAAATLDVCEETLRRQAKALGLAPRSVGRRWAVPVEEFSGLWRAGVRPTDLAARYGSIPATLTNTARRLGLPMFDRHARRISLADYQQTLMARALAASAAETRAAQKRAE